MPQDNSGGKVNDLLLETVTGLLTTGRYYILADLQSVSKVDERKKNPLASY